MRQYLAISGMVLMILGMVSCNKYDFEEDFGTPRDEQPTDTTTTTPTNDNNDDEWENVMDDWYNMINDYTTIDSHKKTNKSEYNVQAPFSVTIGSHIYFTTENKDKSSFVTLHNVDFRNINYGEFYTNEEGDSIRSKTSTQLYECNMYNRNVVIVNAEAYRFINGTRDPFEMPQVVVSFAGHSSEFEEKDIERNDSIFSRENIKDSVKVSFGNRPDIAPYYVSATATIDHFIKMKEQENNETMPEPTFRVEGEILYISTRTASPIFIGGSKEQANWYEVSNVKTTVKTYVVINGQKKEEYNNSELADVNWQSAVYDAGYTNKWVPANINMDATGWTYVLQFSNGEYRGLTVPMNAALISSLKSFKKDNDAKQTPFLNEAQAVKRTFSDGIQYTVNGLYPYTVAAK